MLDMNNKVKKSYSLDVNIVSIVNYYANIVNASRSEVVEVALMEFFINKVDSEKLYDFTNKENDK